MSGRPPNVLYLHSHDTGRYVEPYGYAVPTPNIQQLANQGIVFRDAFCVVPTCSGSRAALLTGQYGHSNGMLGLAHRGFVLRDYSEHVVHTLREGGYWSAMIGEQRIAKRPHVIGYDRIVKVETTHVDAVAPQPWFFSIGFFETHREFFAPSSTATAAGKVRLTLRLTKKARTLLRRRHAVKSRLSVTFTPTGGTARTKRKRVTLRAAPKR